jgi:hypothetical protein
VTWLLKKADSMVGIDEGDYDKYFPAKEAPKPVEEEKPVVPEPTQEPINKGPRYVKKPGSRYLWDNEMNRFTGFTDLDENGKPVYVNKEIIPDKGEGHEDTPLTKGTEEDDYVNAVIRTLILSGVPRKEVNKVIETCPLKTVGDADTMVVRLWQLAQKYGLPRDFLIEQLSETEKKKPISKK